MRKINMDCKRLCDIQAELFEQSVYKLEMSSEVFVRRFMNSKVCLELDNLSFLDDNKTYNHIFEELDDEYGKTTYGSVKYDHDSMYWAGYLYRCFSYTYELSSKVIYKLFPLKEIISLFETYHTLDIPHAIERILESKEMFFDEKSILEKGVNLLKQVRKETTSKIYITNMYDIKRSVYFKNNPNLYSLFDIPQDLKQNEIDEYLNIKEQNGYIYLNIMLNKKVIGFIVIRINDNKMYELKFDFISDDFYNRGFEEKVLIHSIKFIKDNLNGSKVIIQDYKILDYYINVLNSIGYKNYIKDDKNNSCEFLM